jgi:hypothetical protein
MAPVVEHYRPLFEAGLEPVTPSTASRWEVGNDIEASSTNQLSWARQQQSQYPEGLILERNLPKALFKPAKTFDSSSEIELSNSRPGPVLHKFSSVLKPDLGHMGLQLQYAPTRSIQIGFEDVQPNDSRSFTLCATAHQAALMVTNWPRPRDISLCLPCGLSRSASPWPSVMTPAASHVKRPTADL